MRWKRPAAAGIGLMFALAWTQPPPPFATIAGTALSSGRPLGQVTVTLEDALSGSVVSSVKTESNGAFLHSNVWPGRYLLKGARPAYVDALFGSGHPDGVGTPLVIRSGVGVTGLVLAMVRGAVIEGTVRRSNGEAAGGAVVVPLRLASTATAQLEPLIAQRATTDDQGRYRLFGLAAGEYGVAAIAGSGGGPGAAGIGFPVFAPGTPVPQEATRMSVAAGEERTGFDVRLPSYSTSAVRGRILVPGIQSMPALQVRIDVSAIEEPARTLEHASVRASPDGAFASDMVGPGPHQLTAWAVPGNRSPADPSAPVWSSTIEFTAGGQDVELGEFPLRQEATVVGRVIFDGEGPGASAPVDLRVWLRSTDSGGSRSASWRVASDGRFAIRGVPPGRYDFQVRPGARDETQVWGLRQIRQGVKPIGDGGIEIPSDAASSVEVVLIFARADAELAGTLRSAAGDTVSSRVLVVVAGERSRRAAWMPAARAVRPAADGSFEIGRLVPGEYRVAVLNDIRTADLSNPDFLTKVAAAASARITLDAGEHRRQVVIVRQPN